MIINQLFKKELEHREWIENQKKKMEALKKKKEIEDQKRKAQVQNFLHRGKTNKHH